VLSYYSSLHQIRPKYSWATIQPRLCGKRDEQSVTHGMTRHSKSSSSLCHRNLAFTWISQHADRHIRPHKCKSNFKIYFEVSNSKLVSRQAEGFFSAKIGLEDKETTLKGRGEEKSRNKRHSMRQNHS
jgi:hypothetical protein